MSSLLNENFSQLIALKYMGLFIGTILMLGLGFFGLWSLTNWSLSNYKIETIIGISGLLFLWFIYKLWMITIKPKQ